MWIHLSGCENLSRFVVDKKDENQEGGIFALSVPSQSHSESQIPRRCIAPTIWQCCIGVPKVGSFYIYSVTVDNPIPADETVLDRHITDEHWITKDVIENFGETTCHRIGMIDLNSKDVSQLKVAACKSVLPRNHENEMCIWQKREDLFILKTGIMDLPPIE
jgi:hypothetical protein